MGEYCIYLRKSRADQEAELRGEGETLAKHKRTLLEFAQNLKLDIGMIYEEIVSGESIIARPYMTQLLTEVEAGIWNGVLVMEIERLARGNSIDQGLIAQAFKFSDTKIITPTKTYDPNNEFDEEYFEFGLFMSRREYKTINRRLQRGRITSVKEGKFVGNKEPYGYKRVKIIGDHGYTLEIIPEEAKVIQLIYHWYVNGLEIRGQNGARKKKNVSHQTIASELNKLQIPPKYSDRWHPDSVRGILKNPVYIGYIRWNHRKTVTQMVNGTVVKTRPRNTEAELYKGLHPAIISDELFTKANSQEVKPLTIGTEREIKNPLAGLIICGKCGRHMYYRPYYNNKTANRAALICKTLQCDTVGSYLDIVEAKLSEFMTEWLHNYQVNSQDHTLFVNTNIPDAKQVSLSSMHQELALLKKQINNTHELLEREIYSIDKFYERSKAISDKISQVESQIVNTINDIHRDSQVQKAAKKLPPRIETFWQAYENSSSTEIKNLMLKTIIEKIVYHKEKRGTDKFILDIYPKIPQKPI